MDEHLQQIGTPGVDFLEGAFFHTLLVVNICTLSYRDIEKKGSYCLSR